MNQFICVFCEDAKKKLLDMQYVLLKQDDYNSVYVFVHDGRLNFEQANISYILTDTLTF